MSAYCIYWDVNIEVDQMTQIIIFELVESFMVLLTIPQMFACPQGVLLEFNLKYNN